MKVWAAYEKKLEDGLPTLETVIVSYDNVNCKNNEPMKGSSGTTGCPEQF